MVEAKKRIALVVTLSDPGGVQQFLLRFAVFLAEKGHHVTVFAGDGIWLRGRLRDHAIPFVRLKHLGRSINFPRDFLAVFELARELRAFRPDVVHLNSAKAGAVGAVAARLARVPRIVYRIGGWTFLEPLPPFKKWLYVWIERLTAPLKNQIICVNPGDVDVARSLHIKPWGSIVTVPNGIDFETFEGALLPRHTARERLNIDEDTFVFGTVAHLYPAKDLPAYMKACATVAHAFPDARFLLIGEGPERPHIEKSIASLGLSSRVRLLGALEGASQYLKAFDAFVLPSAKEGMAWSLLEAMAAHVPCLATDVGASAFLLQENGWVVPAHNPTALADAMADAMRDHEKRLRFAEGAYRHVRTSFPIRATFEGNFRALFPDQP